MDVPPGPEDHRELQFALGSPSSPSGFPERQEVTANNLSSIPQYQSLSHDDAVYPIRSGATEVTSSERASRAARVPLSVCKSRTSYSLTDKAGQWPLKDKDEAFLMRYFITHLSLWVRLMISNYRPYLNIILV